MMEATNFDFSGSGHLVDPPIVDVLFHDQDLGGYLAEFVPEPACSQEAKEAVVIRDGSDSSRRVREYLDHLRIALRADEPVVRIAHAGGGDFDFEIASGRFLHLREAAVSEDSFTIYRVLQVLSLEVELEFLRQNRFGARAAG